jgi:hypothetical protein
MNMTGTDKAARLSYINDALVNRDKLLAYGSILRSVYGVEASSDIFSDLMCQIDDYPEACRSAILCETKNNIDRLITSNDLDDSDYRYKIISKTLPRS